MLIGYGALKVVVLIGRIGSANGARDSLGSVASIGQDIARAPSDSLRLLADGVVNTRPLLAAPTDRLCPVPMTPSNTPPGRPPSGPLFPPPPQLATASTPAVNRLVRRIGCAAVYCARPRRKTTMVDRGLRAMTTSFAPPPARCQARYHSAVFSAG